MLENSNLLEGQTAKRVNTLLKDYQDVTTKLADLETTKKNILKELFELSQVGVNETNLFTFNVVHMKGRESISLADIKKHGSYLYESLNPYKNYSADYFIVRSIKLKGDRV